MGIKVVGDQPRDTVVEQWVTESDSSQSSYANTFGSLGFIKDVIFFLSKFSCERCINDKN